MTTSPGTIPPAEVLVLAALITTSEYGISFPLDGPEPARMLLIMLRERPA